MPVVRNHRKTDKCDVFPGAYSQGNNLPIFFHRAKYVLVLLVRMIIIIISIALLIDTPVIKSMVHISLSLPTDAIIMSFYHSKLYKLSTCILFYASLMLLMHLMFNIPYPFK